MSARPEFTLRKTGDRMLTLRVEFHVPLDVIAFALAEDAEVNSTPLGRQTRTSALKLAREALAEYGENVAFQETVGPWAEARERAAELFPEAVSA